MPAAGSEHCVVREAFGEVALSLGVVLGHTWKCLFPAWSLVPSCCFWANVRRCFSCALICAALKDQIHLHINSRHFHSLLVNMAMHPAVLHFTRISEKVPKISSSLGNFLFRTSDMVQVMHFILRKGFIFQRKTT